MSQTHTGNVQPSIDNEEHDHLPGKVAVKKIGNYVFNGTDWERTFEPTSTTIVTSGTVKTITETGGDYTRTTTIDSTNPLNKEITVVWS